MPIYNKEYMAFLRVEGIKYIHELSCKLCSKLYERVSGNKKTINHGWCSQTCRSTWHKQNRKEVVYAQCKQCNTAYPKLKENRIFCSPQCYYQCIKENPEHYQLYEKAKKARINSNSDASICKMKDTKLKNGTMIDWKDANWKQYWKKCDALTGRMRKGLLECWDGVDYITGEYIKDNLKLSYSHGDYPTLDHIIPRSECYKQGLTPHQACSASNLKWTTRKNNSRKGNKVAKTK